MRRARIAGLAALAMAAALVATRLPAEAAHERQFFSSRAGVGVEAPPGWTLSLHTGYPKILCLLIHPGGSRISLAVDDAVTAADATALVDQTRPALAAQGLEVTGIAAAARGGVQVDARAARRDQQLRQIYLVRAVPWGKQAIVLTLTTSPAAAAAAFGSLEWVAAHLDLQRPTRAEDRRTPPDGGV